MTGPWVRGIEKMVTEDRYCIDILTQIGDGRLPGARPAPITRGV